MQSLSSRPNSIILLTVVTGFIQATAGSPSFFCGPETLCYLHFIPCPSECPNIYSPDPRTKVCYADCDSPHCAAQCKHRKANCEAPGSACYDPRFIGGDGIVFYFHGKSNEHFNLVLFEYRRRKAMSTST